MGVGQHDWPLHNDCRGHVGQLCRKKASSDLESTLQILSPAWLIPAQVKAITWQWSFGLYRLTSHGKAVGLPCNRIAAAPTTCGAAIDVPDITLHVGNSEFRLRFELPSLTFRGSIRVLRIGNDACILIKQYLFSCCRLRPQDCHAFPIAVLCNQ